MTRGLDAPSILRELDERWRDAAAGASAGVLRACSMTLIGVTAPEDDPVLAAESLAAISHEHPSRTLLVRLLHSGDVDARVSVQCWMPHGSRRQVCSEQIEIDAPVSRLNEVQPLFLGLMAPDLPVTLWSVSPKIAASEQLHPVISLAAKVIVDTSRLAPADALAVVRRLSDGRRFADLAWARITRWRERIAQEIAGGGSSLDAEVSYAGEPLPMAALYLASWLELRQGRQVRLRCEEPREPAPGMGRIRQVTAGGIRMRRIAPSVVMVGCGNMRFQTVFPLLEDSDLLREELGVAGADPQFEQTLRLILERYL